MTEPQTFDYEDSIHLLKTHGLITSIDLTKYPFFNFEAKWPLVPAWPFHMKAIEEYLDIMDAPCVAHVYRLPYVPEHMKVYLRMKWS